MVIYHLSGDEYVIPELVKRSAKKYNNLDIDHENPSYEVTNIESLSALEFVRSPWGQGRVYWPDDGEGEIEWSALPEDRHEEAAEQFEEDLNGKIVVLEVKLFNDDGESAGGLEMVVDDGPLGYVEVLEIELA